MQRRDAPCHDAQRDVAERLSWQPQARRKNIPEFHPLMAKTGKRQAPWDQGCRSISQEVEVISIPLNPVAYPGEIWLMSNLRLSTFHLA